MPKITTEWQRFELLGADGLYELLRFRQGIFVVEQCSPFPISTASTKRLGICCCGQKVRSPAISG